MTAEERDALQAPVKEVIGDVYAVGLADVQSRKS
jgi:hypothetical protein